MENKKLSQNSQDAVFALETAPALEAASVLEAASALEATSVLEAASALEKETNPTTDIMNDAISMGIVYTEGYMSNKKDSLEAAAAAFNEVAAELEMETSKAYETAASLGINPNNEEFKTFKDNDIKHKKLIKNEDFEQKIGVYVEKDSASTQISNYSYKLGGFICLTLAIKFLSTIFMNSVNFDENISYLLFFILNTVVANGVLAILVFNLFKYGSNKNKYNKNTKLQISITTLLLSFLVICFCMFFSNAISSLIIPEKFITTTDITEFNGFQAIVLCIFAIIIIPVIEGIIFRGMILGKLRRFGDLFAIMTSALLYAISRGDISELLLCFTTGIILGYLVIWTGSVIPSIVIHILMSITYLVSTQLFSFAEADLMGMSVMVFQLILFIMMIGGALAMIYFGITKKFKTENACPEIKPNSKFSYVAVNPVIAFALMLNILFVVLQHSYF